MCHRNKWKPGYVFIFALTNCDSMQRHLLTVRYEGISFCFNEKNIFRFLIRQNNELLKRIDPCIPPKLPTHTYDIQTNWWLKHYNCSVCGIAKTKIYNNWQTFTGGGRMCSFHLKWFSCCFVFCILICKHCELQTKNLLE